MLKSHPDDIIIHIKPLKCPHYPAIHIVQCLEDGEDNESDDLVQEINSMLIFWSRESEIDHSVGLFWKRDMGSSDELDAGEADKKLKLLQCLLLLVRGKRNLVALESLCSLLCYDSEIVNYR